MAEILLFHHACGLTHGVRALADTLRSNGHVVHTPDLYDGAIFTTVEDGVAHARDIGFATVLERGIAAADGLPADLVYAGISLGVMAAQALAQQRPGARGAILLEACVPPEEFGGPWPTDLPVQIHGMTDDPFFAHEGDLDAARALVAEATHGELFLYRGDAHLFSDASLPFHDAGAAALLTVRMVGFLAALD